MNYGIFLLKNFYSNLFRVFTVFSLVSGFFPAEAMVEDSRVPKISNSKVYSDSCDKNCILLARHRGRHHGWRGGHGSRGTGICPQPRATSDAPEKFIKMVNPLTLTQNNVLAGKEIFYFEAQPTSCKVCHGAVGNGFGPMAIGAVPPPRNFTCAETMKDISDGQMFYIITHGAPGSSMPAYGNLSDEQVWQLIIFIRTLTKINGSQ